jgi:hypothetical protein
MESLSTKTTTRVSVHIELNRRWLVIHNAILLITALILPVRAENVDVKYRGLVDLKYFECTDVTRSSFIQRVCYDSNNQYMLISLNGTWYHYCEIPQRIIAALKQADSMGRYYNSDIKGQFDCRIHRVPNY